MIKLNNLFLVLILILSGCKEQPKQEADSNNEIYNDVDFFKSDPVNEMLSVLQKRYDKDWFIFNIPYPTDHSVVARIYGLDNFDDMKTKEFYWKQKGIRAYFEKEYGSENKMRFEETYDQLKSELQDFRMGILKPDGKSGYELIRDKNILYY